MGFRLPAPFVLLLLGSSLSPQGRLCTPPFSWGWYLASAMRTDPACRGEVIIINGGVGSATSTIGVTTAAQLAPLRPTHVLMEDYGINDCAIGPVPLLTATANLDTIRASILTANPDAIICHQTMSPASAADVNRVNLAAYYANGTAWAAGHGIETLDNYSNWAKPLNPANTVDGDGLHPLWDDVFESFSFPLISAWAISAMEDFWG